MQNSLHSTQHRDVISMTLLYPHTAFHGKLLRSEFRTNTYLYYFQVAEYMRYNGEYQHPLLSHAASRCPSEETSVVNSTVVVAANRSQEEVLLQERIAAEIPISGTVRVIAKCPLRINKTYFVSAMLHFTRNGRPRLLMCCQHSDEHFALAHLNQLVHRQVCCRHVRWVLYHCLSVHLVLCEWMCFCVYLK